VAAAGDSAHPSTPSFFGGDPHTKSVGFAREALFTPKPSRPMKSTVEETVESTYVVRFLFVSICFCEHLIWYGQLQSALVVFSFVYCPFGPSTSPSLMTQRLRLILSFAPHFPFSPSFPLPLSPSAFLPSSSASFSPCCPACLLTSALSSSPSLRPLSSFLYFPWLCCPASAAQAGVGFDQGWFQACVGLSQMRSRPQ
jgi:hypothetical protein